MKAPREFESQLREKLDGMLAMLQSVVDIDSGSYDGPGVNRVQDVFAEFLEDAGFQVTRQPLAGFGDQLTARWRRGPGKRVLVLGHADTVWPAGTVAQWPYARRGDWLEGPGVGDMKGCVVMALYALRELIAEPDPGVGSITVLIVPDEEISSVGSRDWIEDEARQADFCLTLEPARAGRGLVVGRGAVGSLKIAATGLTSHAAHGRQAGASAVAALAPLVDALESISDDARKLSVSVGVFTGGEARQVVPAEAAMQVDLRAPNQQGVDDVLAGIEEKLALARAAGDPRVRIVHQAAFARPAFPDGRELNRLYALASAVANDLGVQVHAVVSPGGSDGSFPAALGIPTLDGLGPITHEMCSRRERVEIDSIATHGALLAALIQRAGQAGSRHDEPECKT